MSGETADDKCLVGDPNALFVLKKAMEQSFDDFLECLMDKMMDHDERIVSEPVTLNVYDMFWTNKYTDSLGIGVYHTGVEVYGREYSFGGHQYSFSGIYDISPKQAFELGNQYKFKTSIHLGHTAFHPGDIERLIEVLGEEFEGDRYHIVHRNCNHFSEAFSQSLNCSTLPCWVNRLAYISTFIPFLHRCLPKDGLPPQYLMSSIHHFKSPSISTTMSTLATDDVESTNQFYSGTR